MRRRGEITLFLTMVLLSITALLCTIVESARTAGARCYLRAGVDSAMDSLMAQYHRGLWERYRILGLEYEDNQMLEQELGQFLSPYLKAENWYPMKLERAEIKDVRGLTESGGSLFEQEILDYMKYGLIGIVWDELNETEAAELLGGLKEAKSADRVSELYSGHTKEAVRLEKALEDIHECLVSQKENWEQGMTELNDLDGGGFIRQGNQVIRDLRKLPGLVEAYEKRANALDKKLKESRSRFEAEEDLSTEVRNALEDEIRQYEAYTDMDGERRRQVQALSGASQENIAFTQDTIEAAKAVMEYIADWDSEEDGELDEEELWEPVISQWSAYPMLWLGIEFGIRDKEKEGALEWISGLADDGILKLVLPEDAVVSGRTLSLTGAPSEGAETVGRESGSRPASGGVTNLVQRLMVCEYMIRYCEAFKRSGTDGGFYELEYILNGNAGDKDNLVGTVKSLLAVREGLNLVHILSDSGKRQEARTLALAIVGGTGLLPLVSIMTFFIMSVWALGEALADVRLLLSGGRVPLLKSASDWKLSLDSLVDIGRSRSLGGTGGEGGRGLDYKGYLRLLCFAGYDREIVYRTMDVMQLNLQRTQPGFCLAKCACAVDMEAAVGGKHIFFSPALWTKPDIGGNLGYSTVMEMSGTYLEQKK